MPGIHDLRVGYAGGTLPNPTYEHHEGYKEAVKIVFDPTKITYDRLLDIFWRNVDPLNEKGQFCDIGPQYVSAIYVTQEDQHKKAQAKKEAVQKILQQKTLFTDILPHTSFYDAEEYHQNYKKKNPTKYSFYRWHCGRDKRLRALWQGLEHVQDG